MLNVVPENSLRRSRNVPQNTKKKPLVVNNKKISYDEIELLQEENGPESISSSFFFNTKHKSKARIRAEEEEEKLMREQAERAEKLERFQAEVQKRVSALRKIKQQKEMERGMKDITIARNVMRSCVGLSTSFLDPKKFFVSVNPSSSSPDNILHNNSLLSQNQDLLSARSHDSSPNQRHSTEERVPQLMPNASVAIGPYNEPLKIICDDKPSQNISYQITGGMEEKKKLYKIPDNACSCHSKNHVVSTVHPADTTSLQEMKKQQTLQRSLSRKVFMDMEREKAREVERQNRQRMELFLLRNTREAIRKEVETSAREPVVHSQAEIFEEYEIPEIIQNSEDIFPKHSLHKVSYTRKLISLMQLLEEKCNKICVPLPFLCPCGTNPTDPQRNNCANNCPFYKNPSEYCRAIRCLLSSMENSKHPRPFLT